MGKRRKIEEWERGRWEREREREEENKNELKNINKYM
jgi:hypothetical protein